MNPLLMGIKLNNIKKELTLTLITELRRWV
nr:MAG TPA: hypothetical protein [Caudoviricetes sp.]